VANQQLTDRYQSTLASGYTSGGTSLSVTSAGTLETSGDYYMVIEAEGANTEEVFKCTSRSGTTLTVVGAQAGTSASNHASSAIIKGVFFTKDMLKGCYADLVQRGARASLPATGPPIGRAIYQCTDAPYEFVWSGSLWQPRVFGMDVTEPLTANLTQTAITGSPTISTTRGGILITCTGSQSVDYQITTPAYAAPYSVVMVALVTTLSGTTGGEVFEQNAQDSNDFDRIGWMMVSGLWRLSYAKTVAGTPSDLDVTNTNYLSRGGSRLFIHRVWDDGTTNKGGDVGDGFGGWITLHSRGRAVDSTPTKGGFSVSTVTGGVTTKVWVLGLTEFNSIP